MDKNKVLKDLAELVAKNAEKIIQNNQLDLTNAKDLDATLYDRLKVDEKKVHGMVTSIEEVIEREDPEHKLLYSYTHPNGMKVENRVVPFGKILIIYESRPDVTIEAAISAFKAGNRILLKGGKEAKHSNQYLVQLWHQALFQNDLSKDHVEYLELDRPDTQKLIRENTHQVDLIIPRGGDGLINFIRSNTDVPILVSGRGNNFVYVHEDADFDKALNIILDGKKRLSVCNALDKVLFNPEIPQLNKKIPILTQALLDMKIEVLGHKQLLSMHSAIKAIEDDQIFYEEFLGPKILLSTSDSLEEAISTINQYSGGHSATILTTNNQVAQQFLQQVDCAAVYHNASTRFTDGGQFGFGAEIAISTQKLHFRGPIGLGQLVTNKWFIHGEGQVRS